MSNTIIKKIDLIKINLIDLISKYKKTACIIFVIGMITHMFVFTNYLLNQDSIVSIYSRCATVSSGRFGLEYTKYLIPDYAMSWLHGVITIALLSISSCLIVEILKIESKIYQYLTGAIVVTFPSLTATFSYMFTSSAYAIAFFCAVLSVYLILYNTKSTFIFAIIFLVLSLSIYQAYYFVSSSLIMIKLFQALLETGRNQIKKAGRDFLFLIISIIVYFLLVFLFLKFYDTQLNSYASSKFYNDISIKTIFWKIFCAYGYLLTFILHGHAGLVISKFSSICYIILAVIGVIEFLLIVCKNKKILLKSLPWIILFPLSINGLVVSTEGGIHTLTQYSFICLLFMLMVINKYIFNNNSYKKNLRVLLNKSIVIVICFINIANIYVANMSYLRLYIAEKNTYSFYTTLVTQIKSTPGFVKGTKIALIGNTTECVNLDTSVKFSDLDNMVGIFSSDRLINTITREDYIKSFIGFDVEFVDEEEKKNIEELDEYKEMEIYPYYNSVKAIGDYIVVKFE